MKVLIDGVEYIPAKNAIANSSTITRALLEIWWGPLPENYDEQSLSSSLRVIVTDDFEVARLHGDGVKSIQEIVDAIAKLA